MVAEEVDKFLTSIGFWYDNKYSIINDEEDHFVQYQYLDNNSKSFKAQNYTHSIKWCPQTSRTIMWHYNRGQVFHGYIRSVQDFKDMFRLLKK
jgi:hypothetical protein